MKQYLFAYGTLAERPPQEIADAVNHLECVGEGFVFGELYNLGAFPGAVIDSRRPDKIFGKIFALPDNKALLDQLDHYEGFDPQQPAKSLFVRKRVAIRRLNKRAIKGWIYEYNRDVKASPLIKSGHYSRATA